MKKVINIALQGGGAHGAFAWGVLDKILEDGRLIIEAITASSAGSINGVILAYGLHQGGYEQARKALEQFWWRISELGKIYSPVHLFPWEQFWQGWKVDNSFGYRYFDTITSLFSPSEFNPLNKNPLRDLLEESVDFKELQKCSVVKLFLSATNVRSGMVKVFNLSEVTVDTVMASACLPYLFQPVEIDDQYYWDGGYMGNPALFPLFYHTNTQDLLIVHINPVIRREIPKTSNDIHNRVIEITFNSSLMQELRAVAFVQKLLRQNMLKEQYRSHFKNVFVHSIRTDKLMCDLGSPSKFNTDWNFLKELFNRGRTITENWLKHNFDELGQRSTVDLEKEFLSISDVIG